MIRNSLAKVHSSIAPGLVFPTEYRLEQPATREVRYLSPIAQYLLHEIYPHRTDDNVPEYIALRLLDFFSSKRGYIRREGKTFRTEAFYQAILPRFVEAIAKGHPLRLSTLCLCTTLANTHFAGTSPYPHMASYIALENIHKIARAVREIYPPGAQFTLGFEGTLFQPLYFHNDAVLRHALAVLHELNEEAYERVQGPDAPNPVKVIDAVWMIDQVYGLKKFAKLVEKRKRLVKPEETAVWRAWYRKTVSSHYFPSAAAQDRFIEEQARWRHAVYQLKFSGGLYGRGFTCFTEDTIPFTPSGRRTNMLALQLVPESSHLPHHRIITHDSDQGQWRMEAYQDIEKSKNIYAPQFIKKYLYPFYFEKIA